MNFSRRTLFLLASTAASASAFAPSSSQFNKMALSSTVATGAAEAASTDAPSTAAPSSTVLDGAISYSAVSEGMNVDMPMSSSSEESVDRIETGRYNDIENSIALPFLKRPTNLDGSHAGDFGFDPFGFSENYDLYTMQEAELRHARLAMLAVVAWPLSELVAPQWMLQGDYGCAPSVLNGFNPLSFLATAAIFAGFGFFEYMTALRNTDNTESGKKHLQDMSAVWKYGVAGDYNFDPLDLYSVLGDSAIARKGLREVEISHGRMAMLGITSFVVWEKLTGHPIVENSMFFHPNLLLPALAAGYVAFNQVYEVKSDGQYVLQVEKTSEGEARLENLKMSLASLNDLAAENKESMELAGQIVEKGLSLAKPIAEPAKKAIDEWIAQKSAEISETKKAMNL